MPLQFEKRHAGFSPTLQLQQPAACNSDPGRSRLVPSLPVTAPLSLRMDDELDMEFDGLGGSLLAAPQDVLEAVLQEVDAAALSRLKA